MKKISLSALVLGIAAFSNASVNLNLDQEYWNVFQGGSVTVTGSITLTQGWHLTSFTLEFPSNGTDFLSGTFDPGMLAFFGANPSSSYTGALFTINTTASTNVGLYDQNVNNGSNRSEFGVSALNESNGSATDFENYGINVQAVPEPASMAVLGLGAVALLRRRRTA